ncbi:hypothetical protein C7212DRAFT_348305 [Tuber magnatum]|uniref:PiggyBac transposable element-derived protein domain-containing protein n=1 Tax=Tuber magnatum TaxID=42249 RepID=A0A317SD16_9PEZI|nr:hypothetical protein C7212DRAFT_348305 [Tuber magnatum]
MNDLNAKVYDSEEEEVEFCGRGRDMGEMFLGEIVNDVVKEVGMGNSWRWYPVKAGEVMIFVSLIIYMGLYPISTVPDYWRKDGLSPQYRISRFMTQVRFEQLKR